MRRLHLSHRLSLAFAVLLLACCGASAWLQVQANEGHEQEVIQRLSRGLAAHIAGHSALMDANGLDTRAVRDLFGKLMEVNPSVEVYLLSRNGRIEAQAAPAGHLKRTSLDMEPVHRLLAGEPLPLLGDDPRSGDARKVFSAAPLLVDGRVAGYVYVVLLGEQHDQLARNLAAGDVVRTTLWAMALVAGLGLLAGFAAFHWITRPLRRLTRAVGRFQADAAVESAGSGLGPAPRTDARDEIGNLELAFGQMTRRIAEQWRELTAQDRQRRELVANISHDLRTPLTSLHGYLETLRLKAGNLPESDRERYLDIALAQSRKVGRLAEELFELARLECGAVKLEKERFSLPELLQDVFQKFELSAEARQQSLAMEIPPGLPGVDADLGLIERVLTNLLDNAIRHTPTGSLIEVRLRPEGGAVEVQVRDNGPGIPDRLRPHLFARPSLQSREPGSSGGLGLVIVRRILQLHGSDIGLVQQPGAGAVFRFRLAATG